MPTRNVVPTDHHEALEALKLAALQEAARAGFRDIEEGRFQDVSDGDLEEVVAGLGRQAGDRVEVFGG